MAAYAKILPRIEKFPIKHMVAKLALSASQGNLGFSEYPDYLGKLQNLAPQAITGKLVQVS